MNPPHDDLRARLPVAVDAALAAGVLLSRLRGRLGDVEFKDRISEDGTPSRPRVRPLRSPPQLAPAAPARPRSAPIDLVTEADRGAEAVIVAHLLGRFPHDQLIGEEGGGQRGEPGGDWVWLIDPLDGTTNYVHGLPWFAVSVGLLYRGEPALGVIHAPALGRTWWGATGQGAFVDGVPARVSRARELGDGLLATGFPYDRAKTAHELVLPVERALRAARGLRRMGAAALDLAAVAEGVFVGYWEPRLKPWDLAAGVVLVREAGGRVTDFAGGDDFMATGDVIATNGAVHDALCQLVSGPGSGG